MDSFGFAIIAIVLLTIFLRIKRRVDAVDAVLRDARRRRTNMRLGNVSEIQALTNGRVDLTELKNLTAELQELGFNFFGDILGDVTYDPIPAPKPSPIVDPHQQIEPQSKYDVQVNGIGRVFAHPNYGCYAILISAVSKVHFDTELGLKDKIKVAPFRTAIVSMENSADNSWSFANTNRESDPFSQLQRHPRRLGHHMCSATPEQLLRAHLVERDDIAERGGFQWDMELSMEKFRAREEETMRHLRNVYENKNAISVALFLFTYKYKNHDWWLGELGRSPKQ